MCKIVVVFYDRVTGYNGYKGYPPRIKKGNFPNLQRTKNASVI